MPESYALVIGIEDYQENRLPKVEHAENDAKRIHKALQTLGVPDNNMELMLSANATKTSVEHKLHMILTSVKADDQIVIYYAGHGFFENSANLITCYDTYANNLTGTAISLQNVMNTLSDSDCRRAIIFIDSCHSGVDNLVGTRGVLGRGLSDEQLRQFFDGSEYHVGFASCQRGQLSYPHKKHPHGIWTFYLLQALNGYAVDATIDGKNITAGSLQNYLSIEVPRAIRELYSLEHIQTPIMFGAHSRDFLIADLSPILERRKAEARQGDERIASIALVEKVAGRIGQLSGYQKNHREPDHVSDTTRAFVERICQDDLRKETERYFEIIRDALGYGTNEISVEYHDNFAYIICKSFEFVLSIKQDESKPYQYVFEYFLWKIADPALMYDPKFNEIFKNRFSCLDYPFDKKISVRRFIEKVEELPREQVRASYQSERDFCALTIAGLSDEVKIESRSMSILSSSATPYNLVKRLFDIQRILVDKLGLTMLPFSPGEP